MSPRVSDSTIDQIRQANDIATVIGSYFHLHHAGSTWKATCPFHKEKTPSFTVNPQRQIYHCFGCGAGGDVFRFVMEYEKVDFMTAVRMLAQRAGIRLEMDEQRKEPGAVDKDVLFAINRQVAEFYHTTLLNSPEAQIGRDYLAARKLTGEVVKDFMIGYAPDRWDTVLVWAARKYTREQLAAAGLILPAKDKSEDPETGERKDNGRWYDRFRNRLMFPIHDEQGRVVGFSGRVLEKDAPGAKYVNTPETMLFRKGRILYALYKSRRPIVEAREAIVCEGQIDVIRCHVAGFSTAVAAQGTAFTEDHARMLKRYADSVTLVFDADRAGQEAALRAADVFVQVGLSVKIASLPEDEDPDSLILKPDGPAVFRRILDAARPAMEFQIELLKKRENLSTEAGLMRAAAAVLETIQRTPNSVQQARMLQQASSRLGIPEDALRREVQKLSRPVRPAPTSPPPDDAPSVAVPIPPREMALAEHVAADLVLADLVRDFLPLKFISHPGCRAMIQACLDARNSGRDLLSVVSDQDTDLREMSKFAAALMAAPMKATGGVATAEESVKSLILSLRSAALQRRRKDLEQQRRRLQADGASEDKIKTVDLEYCETGYHLATFRTWDSALPLMELERMDPGS